MQRFKTAIIMTLGTGADFVKGAGVTADQRIAEIANAIELLHGRSRLFEIRVLKIRGGRGKPHDAAGYFKDPRKAARVALEYDGKNAEGVYILLNEADANCYARSPERITDFLETTTSDGDITRRQWLVVDCDPQRPRGVCATDAQVEIARHLADQAKDFLREEFGWPDPAEQSSGNGQYLLYAIDLPNDAASKTLLGNVLKALHSTI